MPRKRGSNWTSEEIDELITFYEEHYDLLTTQFCNSIMMQKKATAYQDCTVKLNAMFGNDRDVAAIKAKWSNETTRVRRILSLSNEQCIKTEDDQVSVPPLNNLDSRISRLILSKTNEVGIKETPVDPMPVIHSSERTLVKRTSQRLTMSMAFVDSFTQTELMEETEVNETFRMEQERLELKRAMLEVAKEKLAIKRERLEIESERIKMEKELFNRKPSLIQSPQSLDGSEVPQCQD